MVGNQHEVSMRVYLGPSVQKGATGRAYASVDTEYVSNPTTRKQDICIKLPPAGVRATSKL